ncbi:hypothetical protein CROQUDRAFT_37225 [Cronartium quercuum f. sp. fusiforme G11]|uniref:Uncharacterized protein n=1 Tax=Cronartium quercuum f. sp. fusiforme G11 TaxID=708437 RepID=A0A9P6NSE3_9BASI|nr:hypothetical protein CROQUDRAFT_37225 [Cronartium quercuum f. sp. fusiforme G11]
MLTLGLQEAFFVFICVIWGLVLTSAVPKAPDLSLLAKFNAQFSKQADIVALLDSPSAQDLVKKCKVITLSEAKLGHMKIGKGIVNIKQFFVLYSVAMLAKIGIQVWGPDLDFPDNTLWNEACWISAICLF